MISTKMVVMIDGLKILILLLLEKENNVPMFIAEKSFWPHFLRWCCSLAVLFGDDKMRGVVFCWSELVYCIVPVQ